MIALDLARTYPTATGCALQRAMVEGSPHIGERKTGHVEDYTRRTVRKVRERLGRALEPWMHLEREGHDGSHEQGQVGDR